MNGFDYTRSMKSSKNTKELKKGNPVCIVERNNERSVVVLDHFRNFKDIQLVVEYNVENGEEILIQGKRNYSIVRN